jgi:SCY1-like protein 2
MPPLLGELRTEVLAGTVVPLVISIVRKQSKEDFQATTLPCLMPLISSASGETMMHLLKGTDTLISRMSRTDIDACIVPLICRALDSGVTGMQVGTSEIEAVWMPL